MGGQTMKNVATFSVVTIAATLIATIVSPATNAGDRNKEKAAAKM
jgi:hypothetical protein